MRASRPLSARLATVGTAVAIAALGLVGTAGLVATADAAGAATPVGNTVCALAQPAGTVTINASVAGSINPSPVNAGNAYTIKGLALDTGLTSTTLTEAAAGETLSVTFTTTISATGATPASQRATFTGNVTLPKPFPIGSTAPISLPGSVGAFTALSAGATSTAVSLSPSGQLSVALGSLAFAGPCTGGSPVQFASAAVIPAAGFITNVIPAAGVGAGGTTVKLVGTNFLGVTKVDFGTTAATDVRLLSPTVITCVAPPSSIADYGDGNTQAPVDVTITTAAGPSKKQPLDVFTYVDPTLGAIVSSVTPNVGTSAGGNAVTISGIGFNAYGSEGPVPEGAAFAVYFGSVNQPNFTVVNDNTITTTAPPGAGLVNVRVVGYDETTLSPTSSADRYNYNPGYILGGSDGGIYSFGQVPGNAGFFGSAGSLHLNKPIVGMAATPNGGGYWLVASDGGVFSYGDAQFYGSTGNLTLNKPIVGIAATPDGAGYWLVASDGGIFTFGDAMFYGSTGSIALNKPIVGMARTPNGDGYWLVASDGGVFGYGDAGFHGSAGSLSLLEPVVGMAADPAGTGYWLVAADGGVFTYGASARFFGSLSGTALSAPISAIAPTSNGGGYWLVGQGGAVFGQGDAGFFGDMAGFKLGGPIVGFAPIQADQIPV